MPRQASLAPAFPMKAADMAVKPDEFRHALGQLAAGVSVLTAWVDGAGPSGMTVTSFTSLSLTPPLALVCVDKRAWLHDRLEVGQPFAINVLCSQQEHAARRFASRGGRDPFADVPHSIGPHGVPRLAGALAVVGLRVTERLPGGDHTIVIGEVEWTETDVGEPLMHWRGQYARVEQP